MKYILTTLLLMGLIACSPPAPISEGATQAVIKNCEQHGMATRIFNSGAVSIVECVEIKKETK